MQLQKKPIKYKPGQNPVWRCAHTQVPRALINAPQRREPVVAYYYEKTGQKSSHLHSYADYIICAFHFSYRKIKMCTPKAGGCVWSLCASLSTTISEAVGQPRRGEGPARYINVRCISTPQQTHQQSQEPAAAAASSSQQSSRQHEVVRRPSSRRSRRIGAAHPGEWAPGTPGWAPPPNGFNSKLIGIKSIIITRVASWI